MYSPGTILSFGFGPTLEQVIVLTENKVATKTFAGHPVTRRDIMSLADWQILAQSLGQEIQTDYLPLPPNPLLPLLPRNLARPAQTHAAPESGRGYLVDLNSAAQAGSSSAILELSDLLAMYRVSSIEEALAMTEVPEVPEDVAAPVETYPIGTKLSWKHSDGANDWRTSNSRTAIVLKDGILQVKEVIQGVVSMDGRKCIQKFFSSLADWKATLPAGGTITASVPTEDFSLPVIQRKAAKPIVAETDVDYIAELQRRYGVHSKLQEGLTPREQRRSLIIHMVEMTLQINSIMQSSSITGVQTASPAAVSDAMRNLSSISKRLARYASRMEDCHTRICRMPDQADVKPISFINNYRQRIMAFVGGREVEITSSKKLGRVGVAWERWRDSIGKWFIPTVETTFAQLGIDLKADGYPRLKVYYRGKSIEL